MLSPIHKPFIPKILPATPLNPKILTLVRRQSSDSKRSEGGGCRPATTRCRVYAAAV